MKIIKTKTELVDIVLGTMRSYEGCEELQDIRIEIDQKGAWFIAPCDLTARFSERVERAALAAQIALRQKYGVEASELREVFAVCGLPITGFDKKITAKPHPVRLHGLKLSVRTRI